MVDITESLKAKSDQLNATDISGSDLVICIRAVDYNPKREQPNWVYFDGDNNRPWKPSKGMARVLANAWGSDNDNWIGKYAQLWCNPTVKFGGKEVGGIEIRALSDIPERGINCVHAISRTKREPLHIPLLAVQTAAYPDDKFNQALPKMIETMQSGKMSLQQVIAHCQKTGQLSPEQLKRLEESAPVEINEDEDVM